MNDGYKELAAAIVERAVIDYKTALKNQDNSVIYSLERFFRSAWFEVLSECDGEVLMQMVRRSVS
ncbi:MAG TPA: hypothetical protein PLH98_15795 [Ruminococcus flavefaciens]|mgnify:FL=1|nr:hypothetical protein [Ruminococcus flavefaciens]